jgi:hypothetical protein
MSRKSLRVAEQADLMRDLMRDPFHLPELLLLHAQAKLSPGASDWGDKAKADPPSAVRKAVRQARNTSRIDGAISGTPFLLALIPAYVASLWEQARMALRMAALSGRDPASPETAAELLVLRGVHPDTETATRALESAIARERQDLPDGRMAKARETYLLGIRVLMFAAFLDPPKDEPPSRLRQTLGFAAAAIVWVVTWIVPLAFMALMSWSCESSARRMAELTSEGWLGELDPPERETLGERIGRIVGIVVIGVVPVAVIAFAVTHPSNQAIALASLIGLIEALTLGVIASRDGRLVRRD